MTFSASDRTAALDRLGAETFDVVVIGGGITGAGVLLDAASRGLKAALVERADFAAGTSSRSSKLIHGGLRYLEQRDFGLVYEALAERQVALRNAPHLVRVQPFLFPIFARGEGRARRRSARAMAKAIGTALWLYDLTGGLRIGRRHRRIKVDEALEHFPALDPERIASCYLYYDARADDARLTLQVIRTAVERFQCLAVNYAGAVGFEKSGERVTAVRVRDELSGNEHVVRCGAVVNAAGVWADQVRAHDEGYDPDTIRPAKGVHITLPRAKLAVDVGAVLPVPDDRRSVFVIPWNDTVYVGTTDTDYDGSVDEPVCTAEEIEYLLGAVNASVREPLDRDDVLGTWAGVRPLVKAAATERTADLSRRHWVGASAGGVVTVTGGKLTTYRRMAIDTVDAVAEVLARELPRSPTKKLPLFGAEGLETVGLQLEEDGWDPELLQHLLDRHGDQARAVAIMLEREPDLGEPLVSGLPYPKAEALYAVRYEMAMTLDDVLSRRTRALLLDREASARAAPAVASLIGPELGWDTAEAERQLEAFSQLVERLRTAASDPALAAADARLGA